MNIEELLNLIRKAPALDEAVRSLALAECAAGGDCFNDSEFLPLTYWRDLWSARAARMQKAQLTMAGLEAAVVAFASSYGNARCVSLSRPGRTVLIWLLEDGTLIACVAY